MYQLGEANQFGSYYLAPNVAIHRSKRLKYNSRTEKNEIVDQGHYIVLKNEDDGFIFDGPKLRQFSTPEDALKFLNE